MMNAHRIVWTLAAFLTLAGPFSAGAQTAGPDLLSWMGLETGDTMAFETQDGARMCVTVGAPRRMGGRAFAPLDGLAWPGLASDSKILLSALSKQSTASSQSASSCAALFATSRTPSASLFAP